VFATAQRLAAWAGVAPGNHESAGRRKGAATRKGNVFLEATLFAAASAAVRTKGSYYPYSCGCTSMSRRPQQQA
jgi:transposase